MSEVAEPVRDTTDAGFVHPALFYPDLDTYLNGVGAFVRAGVAAGEPVFVAVPGARLEALRDHLDDIAAEVAFHDMAVLGRNPGRILAALSDFADRGTSRRARLVGEPIWAGRTATEVREATRHEALINSAFRGRPATILCPYDTTGLAPGILADALRTHPVVLDSGDLRPCPHYTDPAQVCASCDTELSQPQRAEELAYGAGQLAEVRRWVDKQAAVIGLDDRRRGDLVLAVGEAAGNSVVHGGGRGVLRIWTEPGSVVVEVHDAGRLSDPLAGRKRPDLASANGGRGLWMIHQLCDLVEVRAAPDGLTLRLHIAVCPATA